MARFCSNPIMYKVQDINGDRIDSTIGISAVIGQAFHVGLEIYHGGNGDIMPANESEAVEFGLKAAIEHIQLFEEGFIRFNARIPNKDRAYEYLAFAFNSYIKEIPWDNGKDVLATEEKLEAYIEVDWRGQKLSLPVKLKGVLDLLKRVDGKLKIVDHKAVYSFSNPDKIDGAKIIQAIIYYFLVYAIFEEEPYSFVFEETKYSKNSKGDPQVKRYEIVYSENELFFDFFFRLYQDITDSLLGKSVYVPNINALYDNEIAIVAYILRLDVEEEQAKLLKRHKVENITDLLKKKIQSASNMEKMLQTAEKTLAVAKNIDYSKMKQHEKIQTKLIEHGIVVQYESTINGATVDLYRFTPSIGLKMSKLRSYVADIEQVLGISGVRVLAPIPNTSYVGFEVPRATRAYPGLPVPEGFNIAIGERIDGTPLRYDIREAPHLLVAGASGSGKSVFLGSLIKQLSSIGKADIHMFDPKRVELVQYASMAKEHATDPRDIRASLAALTDLMEKRYEKFAEKGAKNIQAYGGSMKYKFVVIDEYADLAHDKEISAYVLRLAQKARAAGIHIILATQRPSVDIITGTIKANFPVKVAFRTAKAIDSQVVLDQEGAEKLLGKGDMLFSSHNGTERLQGYNI